MITPREALALEPRPDAEFEKLIDDKIADAVRGRRWPCVVDVPSEFADAVERVCGTYRAVGWRIAILRNFALGSYFTQLEFLRPVL